MNDSYFLYLCYLLVSSCCVVSLDILTFFLPGLLDIKRGMAFSRWLDIWTFARGHATVFALLMADFWICLGRRSLWWDIGVMDVDHYIP
jgi:hypothetical protein